MSAFAPLTLQNNAAADVVFKPQNRESGVATYMTDNDILDAKRRVTMSVALPKNGSQVVRIKQKVMIPIMDTVDTSKKIGEAYTTIETVIPKQASETTRLDLRKHAATLLTNDVTTAAFADFEAIF